MASATDAPLGSSAKSREDADLTGRDPAAAQDTAWDTRLEEQEGTQGSAEEPPPGRTFGQGGAVGGLGPCRGQLPLQHGWLPLMLAAGP